MAMLRKLAVTACDFMYSSLKMAAFPDTPSSAEVFALVQCLCRENVFHRLVKIYGECVEATTCITIVCKTWGKAGGSQTH